MKDLELHKGTEIDGSRLVRKIGCGQSGEIWLAAGADGSHAAVRIFYGAEDAVPYAEREFDTARRLAHAGILVPTALSALGPHPAIFMPYCEGRSVGAAAACLGERAVWSLLKETASALAHIHERGYGHFDVRPSHILYDGSRFLLTGFGLCAKTGETPARGMAPHPDACRFRAPEYADTPVAASDVWALGATVFYLYMGCHVFSGLGGRSQHRNSPVPCMRKSMPDLSGLVMRCLDFDPAGRPAASEIHSIACANLSRLESEPPARGPRSAPDGMNPDRQSEFWPDLMIETGR